MLKWKKEQEQFLIDNYGILSDKEICEKLNKNLDAIRYKASKLKIKKNAISIGTIQNYLNQYDYTLISTEYKGAKSKLIIKCNKHNKEKLSTWSDIKQNKFRCEFCKSELISSSLKTTYDEIKYEFEKRDLILLSKDYINEKEQLAFICKIHKDEIQYITFDSLKRSTFGCKFCATESSNMNNRLTDIEIFNRCKSHGYTPIDVSEYSNIEKPIKVKCDIHGTIFYFNVNNSNKVNDVCPDCFRENNSGENSKNWKGGITEINHHLRGLLGEWKQKSFEKYNYKCCISGQGGSLQIHHDYPFKEIVQDVFRTLKFQIKPNVCDYTTDELNKITELFLNISMDNLGYPLTKELHKEFHDTYGLRASKSDFWEFYNFKMGNLKIVKENIKKKNINNRKVKCLNTGDVFESASECERKSFETFGTKLYQPNISRSCRLKRLYKGYEFVYA